MYRERWEQGLIGEDSCGDREHGTNEPINPPDTGAKPRGGARNNTGFGDPIVVSHKSSWSVCKRSHIVFVLKQRLTR